LTERCELAIIRRTEQFNCEAMSFGTLICTWQWSSFSCSNDIGKVLSVSSVTEERVEHIPQRTGHMVNLKSLSHSIQVTWWDMMSIPKSVIMSGKNTARVDQYDYKWEREVALHSLLRIFTHVWVGSRTGTDVPQECQWVTASNFFLIISSALRLRRHHLCRGGHRSSPYHSQSVESVSSFFCQPARCLLSYGVFLTYSYSARHVFMLSDNFIGAFFLFELSL